MSRTMVGMTLAMHKLLPCAALVFALSAVATAAPKIGKSDQVLADAKAKAADQHKSIFLIFGASWCPECHTLDSFLEAPEVRQIFDKYFVIARLSVAEELAGHPNLNNPGSDTLLVKFGGIGPNGEVGLPYVVVLDEKAKGLANSNRPVKGKAAGEGIGFPTEPEEIAWFLSMLTKGAPSLTPEEARVVEQILRRVGG